MKTLLWLFWNHCQKICGSILAAMAALDLESRITDYHDDIAGIIGEKKYHAIRLTLGALILIRALLPAQPNVTK